MGPPMVGVLLHHPPQLGRRVARHHFAMANPSSPQRFHSSPVFAGEGDQRRWWRGRLKEPRDIPRRIVVLACPPDRLRASIVRALEMTAAFDRVHRPALASTISSRRRLLLMQPYAALPSHAGKCLFPASDTQRKGELAKANSPP